ncbi:MAG: SagB family peptide dehydrogenase [Halobacteriales archaeon]|nr:SagB family peptide dehydrogenase [Halobacteriales archaeon]
MSERTGAIEYHERTKHSPRSVREASHGLDFENKPRPFKRYRDRPTRALAEAIRPPMQPTLAAVADPGPATADDELDLETLTSVLYHAAGVTKELEVGGRTRRFRAAACTGALYHIDLYLVAGEPGPLPAGVYHHDPEHHRLDVLRTGDYRGALAAAAGGHPAVADAPVSVVTTSTWWRNAWKYRARTYRHAFWDSGTVLANLLATAAALDLPAELALGFADAAVATLLGVDVGHEAPLEVVPLGTDAPAPAAPAVDPVAFATEPLSEDEVDYPLIGAAYRGSSIDDGEAARGWREAASSTPVGTREPGDGERVPLDPVGPDRASKVPLYHAVRRRGSCREYAREALNARKVATVLDRAVRGVPTDATRGRPTGLRFNDVYCLVNGLDGVESGVYQYHPSENALERLRAGDCRQAAGHLALDQPLGADAALNVYFMADLEAVVDALGDRGYRAAQLEAAVTAGRCYLGAYAHRDLGATGLTFYDDEVTEFLSPRAAGQTPTFLWTLGRPA